jgi:hypothetical protein
MYAWMGGTRRKMTELAKPKNAELKRQKRFFQRKGSATPAESERADAQTTLPRPASSPMRREAPDTVASYDVRAMLSLASVANDESSRFDADERRRLQRAAERRAADEAATQDEPPAKRSASGVRATQPEWRRCPCARLMSVIEQVGIMHDRRGTGRRRTILTPITPHMPCSSTCRSVRRSCRNERSRKRVRLKPLLFASRAL